MDIRNVAPDKASSSSCACCVARVITVVEALGPVEVEGMGHELRAFDNAMVKLRSLSVTFSDDDGTCRNSDMEARCWVWTVDEEDDVR